MISVPGHRVDPAEKVVLPTVDPVFLELIAWQPALDALVQLGWPAGGATFTDGYIISKPPHSPPLFWHCAQPPLAPWRIAFTEAEWSGAGAALDTTSFQLAVRVELKR